MKYAMKTAKGSMGFAAGFGMSCLFAQTMDDVIYNDLKRNVIMPIQML